MSFEFMQSLTTVVKMVAKKEEIRAYMKAQR